MSFICEFETNYDNFILKLNRLKIDHWYATSINNMWAFRPLDILYETAAEILKQTKQC